MGTLDLQARGTAAQEAPPGAPLAAPLPPAPLHSRRRFGEGHRSARLFRRLKSIDHLCSLDGLELEANSAALLDGLVAIRKREGAQVANEQVVLGPRAEQLCGVALRHKEASSSESLRKLDSFQEHTVSLRLDWLHGGCQLARLAELEKRGDLFEGLVRE